MATCEPGNSRHSRRLSKTAHTRRTAFTSIAPLRSGAGLQGLAPRCRRSPVRPRDQAAVLGQSALAPLHVSGLNAPARFRACAREEEHSLYTYLRSSAPPVRFLPVYQDSFVFVRTDPADNKTAEVRLVLWKKEELVQALGTPALERNSDNGFPARYPAPSFAQIDDRIVAVDVSHMPEVPFAKDDGEFVSPLRRCLALLDAESALVAGRAKAALAWHRSYMYCGYCGATTRIASPGGQSRLCSRLQQCSGPKRRVYPRINPSVIVLVTRRGDTECLLGRQARWPEKRYSALAGFCEVGETLEAAVFREVLEESGVEVDLNSIRYCSSQPWPYPDASLMVAFYAAARDSRIHQSDNELEDVGWYRREWLADELAKPPEDAALSIPGRSSIANRLIESWVSSSPGELIPSRAPAHPASP